MLPLAICEGSDPNPVGGALIVLVAVGFYGVPVFFAFKTASPDRRWWLGLVYAIAVGISFLFGSVIPDGLSNPDADYLELFFGGLGFGAAVGLIGAIRFPKDAWRFLVLGLLGGGTYTIAIVGWLFFALETTGACLG